MKISPESTPASSEVFWNRFRIVRNQFPESNPESALESVPESKSAPASESESSSKHPTRKTDVARYSSEEVSGNESTEARMLSEAERQADFNRHKEEMKRKRRRKKRTSSSMQSSCFQVYSQNALPY
uniref:Uncharacterized protein n=1 Tax=Anopheles melas TaxID=34690 RepID=A0A182TIZ1_9DIPT